MEISMSRYSLYRLHTLAHLYHFAEVRLSTTCVSN